METQKSIIRLSSFTKSASSSSRLVMNAPIINIQVPLNILESSVQSEQQIQGNQKIYPAQTNYTTHLHSSNESFNLTRELNRFKKDFPDSDDKDLSLQIGAESIDDVSIGDFSSHYHQRQEMKSPHSVKSSPDTSISDVRLIRNNSNHHDIDSLDILFHYEMSLNNSSDLLVDKEGILDSFESNILSNPLEGSSLTENSTVFKVDNNLIFYLIYSYKFV